MKRIIIREDGNNHPSTFYRHNLNIEHTQNRYAGGMEFKGTITNFYDEGKKVELISRWEKDETIFQN